MDLIIVENVNDVAKNLLKSSNYNINTDLFKFFNDIYSGNILEHILLTIIKMDQFQIVKLDKGSLTDSLLIINYEQSRIYLHILQNTVDTETQKVEEIAYRLLNILIDLIDYMNKITDTNTLIEHFVKTLHDFDEIECVQFFKYNHEIDAFILKSHYGCDFGINNETLIPLDEDTHLGYSFTTKEAVRLDAGTWNCDAIGIHKKYGYAVPIIIENRYYGVIIFSSSQPYKYKIVNDFILTYTKFFILYLSQLEASNNIITKERFYRNIIDNIQDPMIIINANQKITYVNNVFENTFGYKSKELIGNNITSILADNIRSKVYNILKEAIVKSDIKSFRKIIQIPLKNSELHTFDMNIYFNKMNFKSFGIIYLIDLEKRKNIELLKYMFQLELDKKESELKKVFTAIEQSNNLIIVTDVDGNIEYVNPYFCKISEFTREEAIGKNPRIVKSGKMDERIYKDLWDTILSGKIFTYEFENISKNGNIYWVNSKISPILDNHGKITHFIAVQEDITEKKLREVHLKELAKYESIAKFTNGIVHDFKNLLTIINLNFDLILEKFDEDKEIEEEVKAIKSAISQASIFTNRLLQFSSEREIKKERIDITSTIYELYRWLKRLLGERINLNLTLPDKSIVIEYDKELFNQIIINLVLNAKDAIADFGEININIDEIKPNIKDIQILYDSVIEIGTGRRIILSDNIQADQNYIWIQVSDTGKGMDEYTLASLFDPYFTTKDKGTGIGLSIIYGTVKNMNGFILVNSELNRGTIFDIFIPKS